MNLFDHYRRHVAAVLDGLIAEGALPAGLDTDRVTVEPPREAAHGDLTTNAAMVLAKPAGMKPRDLAELVAARLRSAPHVVEVAIAGPGFINLRLDDAFWHERLAEILRTGPSYGNAEEGRGGAVNVEYVSANPTGPLHVGHGRGAVFGDALAALLEKAGHKVTREYYINDAGAQVDVLARSAYLRYREALGERVEAIPEGLYPGEYLVPVGRRLAERDGGKWLDVPEETWLPEIRAFAIAEMIALIREDLAALGVRHDVFTSERTLVEAGKVQTSLDDLAARGLIYKGVLEPPKGKTPEDWEPREQTLFRATQFGDDVDRPLQKSDGSWTYFATDVAYHRDKYERGFNSMIDVWGADHGGYVKRMTSAVKAVSGGAAELDCKLCQMVNLLDDGKPVKMSKRAGTFVTLREVVEEVGKDVVRFIMLTRKNDAHLDFDLAKVLEQSKDNPVFYVQYAHARICSVFRHASEFLTADEMGPEALAGADLARLDSPLELGLIKTMAVWPRIVDGAAEAHEPHRLAFYLYDLANQFHVLWTKGKEDTSLRFLMPEDRAFTLTRLALLKGVAFVIASGLAVFGVTPVEEMR